MYEELARKKEMASKHVSTPLTQQTNAVDTTYASPTNTTVFFSNLPPSFSVESLYKLCAYYGYVRSVSVKPPKQNGDLMSSIGFVSMSSHEEAERVVELLHNVRIDVGQSHSLSPSNLRFTLAGRRVPVTAFSRFLLHRILTNRTFLLRWNRPRSCLRLRRWLV